MAPLCAAEESQSEKTALCLFKKKKEEMFSNITCSITRHSHISSSPHIPVIAPLFPHMACTFESVRQSEILWGLVLVLGGMNSDG